jgi:hypothetical protein
MTRRKPLGLIEYLLLSEEEQNFYKLMGRLPSEMQEKPTLKKITSKPPKNQGGRPKLRFHIDEKRAYYLWLIAKELPDDQRRKITNRKLIEYAKNMPFKGYFGTTRTPSTIEQSISRGKKTLRIDKNWNSKVCVLLQKDIHKLKS